jgi:hypothetical protein
MDGIWFRLYVIAVYPNIILSNFLQSITPILNTFLFSKVENCCSRTRRSKNYIQEPCDRVQCMYSTCGWQQVVSLRPLSAPFSLCQGAHVTGVRYQQIQWLWCCVTASQMLYWTTWIRPRTFGPECHVPILTFVVLRESVVIFQWNSEFPIQREQSSEIKFSFY